jgi:3-dehydroquinate synthetase
MNGQDGEKGRVIEEERGTTTQGQGDKRNVWSRLGPVVGKAAQRRQRRRERSVNFAALVAENMELKAIVAAKDERINHLTKMILNCGHGFIQ